MVVLEQSPWYQELITRERREMLREVLEARFGPLTSELSAKLDALTPDLLSALVAPAARVATLDDFEALLPA